jgi:hypothetical protein
MPKKFVFHSFIMGDVEDPEIYAAVPLSEFMATEKGQWVKANCPDPVYSIGPDAVFYQYRVTIHGVLEDRAAVEYVLRWGFDQ